MALPVVTTQLFVDGAWVTYSSYDAEGWSMRVGPDVESGTQPNQMQFTLANDDLSLDPTNVTSSLYGKIGRNTPTRMLIDGTQAAWGEASSYQPDRTVEHVAGLGRGRSTMQLTAEGILRRLSRWDDPLDSPLRRKNSSYTSLIGYWPLEDPVGSTNLSQVVAGLKPATFSGTVILAGDPGAGGSAECITVGTDTRIDGRFRTSSISGWQVSFCTKLATAPASASFNIIFAFVDTLNRTWSWQVSNSTMRVVVSDSDGTILKQSDVGYGTLVLTQWVRYRIKTTVSGGTLTFEPAWFIQDGSTITGFTDTFASSSTGQPRDWRITGNSYIDGAGYGHVFAISDASIDLLDAPTVDAFDGFLDERAGARFARIMGDLGLPYFLSSLSPGSALMGRQKPGRLLDLLQECVDSDGGIMYDDATSIAVIFKMNKDLLNKTPALALTYGVDVSPPLRKIVDDVQVANDVTATNWDGTSVRVEETSGALSTAAPPNGVGRYKKTLNVSLNTTDRLIDRANWELNLGTLDRPRYQAITIDLLAFPAYRSAVTALRPGNWISLAGVEPDVVYLMIMTIERSGDAARDTVTLNCVPADVYRVLLTDTAGYLAGSAETRLIGSLTTTGTSAKIGTPNPKDVWSAATPYDVMMAGERMTVTAMSAVTTDATLSANGFEAGTGGWTATSCTLTQSSTFANTGSFSGLMTVTGSPTEAYIRKSLAQSPYVTPGLDYTLSIWVRSTAALTSVSCHIDWVDAAGTFLSRSGAGGALASGAWTNRTVTATAPAGAVYAQYGATIGGSPTAGTLLYTDDLLLTAVTIKYQTATLTRSVNGAVKAQVPGALMDVFQPSRFGL